MKKILSLILICMFIVMVSGCGTKSQTGAVLGGLTGMAGSALGKGDRRTTAIIGGIGTAIGYAIGNELDKNDQQKEIGSYNNQNNTNKKTDCRKITKRVTVDGKTTETIEEVCEGNKTERIY